VPLALFYFLNEFHTKQQQLKIYINMTLRVGFLCYIVTLNY